MNDTDTTMTTSDMLDLDQQYAALTAYERKLVTPWRLLVQELQKALTRAQVDIAEALDKAHAYRAISTATLAEAAEQRQYAAELEALIGDLARDLEFEIRSRYNDVLDYPQMQRAFEADMEIVESARRCITRRHTGKEN